MFSALHPALLGGLALVGVPILIHLLLRKRPRPRPWAAMRWLLAAAKAAQRQWRLTNLLLLAARCLIVTLAVLAVARPTIAGVGGGKRLVLVIDRTASMGPRGSDPGPLASAKSELARIHLPYRSVAVVTVDAKAELIADGPPDQVLSAIAALEASALPGGLDAAARHDAGSSLLRACDRAADVVLISDFAQDDGLAISALLTPVCHAITRWRVGAPAENAGIIGIEGAGDQLPDTSGELTVRIAGSAAEVALAVDDAPFITAGRVAASPGGTGIRIAVPPLAEGAHRLRIKIDDGSLAYDNQIDLPVTIRPRVEALAVQDQADYVTAALHADDGRSFAFHATSPAHFASEALPLRGVIALRGALPNATRLRDWTLGGGVLWASLPLLNADPLLKPLLGGIEVRSGTVPGGPFACGDHDIDDVLSIASLASAPAVTLPGNAEVLLRAGLAPVVVAVPAGRGWVVVEVTDLVANRDLEARGTTPWWVVRVARRLASRLDAPRLWLAGAPAPVTATLKRGGEVVSVTVGDPLLVAPGAWTSEQGAVVVLPSREEGRIDRLGGGNAVLRPEQALPRSSGADLGPLLAVAVLLAALGEGLFAAWAGRTYGR